VDGVRSENFFARARAGFGWHSRTGMQGAALSPPLFLFACLRQPISMLCSPVSSHCDVCGWSGVLKFDGP
jgi:hypothetical protein